MRVLVVVNRSAGTADDGALAAVLEVLRDGADVEVAATAGIAELERVVAGRGDRRPVVVGGDGSVHAAVAALDRAGGLDPARPIGLVPLGTGNDLARSGCRWSPRRPRGRSCPGCRGRWTCCATTRAGSSSTPCTPVWGRRRGCGPSGSRTCWA
ncbi:hypothetical protein JOD57_004710 [Geodermatophilus bullaregiensis]|uniref:diacylglycerol/lipid kinase family protein n=1 Tax=Geodermatophilus bullaregiensis TaxID=1564160 RepID=UPI0027DC577A|nr:diacylglycerol kinase family protein [Geodermatophilus bullaregiensis]MBM7808873.1 hypothetical protein [Geodermatophilus bullaregiensis]